MCVQGSFPGKKIVVCNRPQSIFRPFQSDSMKHRKTNYRLKNFNGVQEEFAVKNAQKKSMLLAIVKSACWALHLQKIADSFLILLKCLLLSIDLNFREFK